MPERWQCLVEDSPVIGLFGAMASDIKDTAAWRIIEQVLEHTWGGDYDMGSDAVLSVCDGFVKGGGSWRGLMEGDSDSISLLEKCIGKVIDPDSAKIASVALRVAFSNESGRKS